MKGNTVESRMLAMVELRDSNSSKSISLASEIVNTLNRYSVNIKQIVSITSDNGANMVKSTKILSQCCYMDGDNDSVDIYKNDIYLKNIKQYDNFPDDRIENIVVFRCAAHTAQLCALNVMKNETIKSM